MSLLVLHKRPVVRAVLQHVVLDDLVLGGIVRILADASYKLGVVGIDTGIDHGNGDAPAGIVLPNVPQVHVVQIGLQSVVGIAHAIDRTHRNTLIGSVLSVLFALDQIADAHLIVRRHLLQVCQIIIIAAHIQNGGALGQGQSRKPTVRGHTQGRAQPICQLLRLHVRGIIQHNALRIVRALVALQLRDHIVAVALLNCDLLLYVYVM